MWGRLDLLDPLGTCLRTLQTTAPHVLLTLNKQGYWIGRFGLVGVNSFQSGRGDMAALRGYGKQVQACATQSAIMVNKPCGVGAVGKQREKGNG